MAASRRRGPSVASADPRTPTGRGRTTIRRADALGDDLRADTARQLSAFDLVADPAPDAG
ncbi:MAG: hypothetical protein M3140_04755 [Actinomycetota bacterium]|nr:hypothetical protein [Actinomycetota bacterium]